MVISELQKKTAQAIVNIFETSRIHGKYGQVTLLRGDSGHLTYGRSQTTLGSGNLHTLINAYCDADGAAYGEDLQAFLDRLRARDTDLDHDPGLRGLLRDAGDDPVMHEVQDAFFDRVYWTPSFKHSRAAGVSSALGTAVVYDSHIHGSWGRMRDRTRSQYGTVSALGENEWIDSYVRVRGAWLGGHSNHLLRRTVYRMDAFRKLIDADNWILKLPIRVRGVEITKEALETEAPVRASAEDETDVLLRKGDSGPAVKALQQALVKHGFSLKADGKFGAKTEKAVKEFQEQNGLVPDGIVGPATRSALAE